MLRTIRKVMLSHFVETKDKSTRDKVCERWNRMIQNIMGFKTEINYILKSSSDDESKDLVDIETGESFKVMKSGLRTYVLNASIMFADSKWRILGMCVITESHITCRLGSWFTEVTATVVTRFSAEESAVVSKLVLNAEKAREILGV